MTNSKTTKKALLSSVLALTMCVAMLIATTFAWFTDTASTSVNKIQAGTLDVALEMNTGTTAEPSWVSAEGKTLEFQKAEGGNGQTVLWEPGCTYELPQLRVVNNGSLKLKYKIAITGIQGNAKLNEAIEWTIKAKDTETTATELASKEYTLEAKDGETVYSDPLTIKGRMRESAGNEYQGLSIDGISITVYATQAQGEYDSNGNDYDGSATYNYKSATIVDENNGKTTTLEAGHSYSVGVANVTVDANGDITYENDTETAQTVTITTDGESLTINAPKDTVYHYGRSGEIKVIQVANQSYHEFGEVEYLNVTSGRVVIENGDNVKTLQVQKANNAGASTGSPAAVIAVPESVVLKTDLRIATGTSVAVKVIDSNNNEIDNESFTVKKSTTGVEGTIPAELVEVLKSTGMSIEEPKNVAAKIGTTEYDTLHDAILAAEDGQIVTLLKNSSGSGLETKDSSDSHGSFTIDFNGYTYTVGKDTVGSSGTTNQAMHWGKSADAINIKDGRIIVEDSDKLKMIMQNYVKLTMENMVIDGTALNVERSVYDDNYKENYPNYYGKQRPMFNNNGSSTMTLKNCTISLPSGSTYGVSASEGDVVLENTRVNGSASIEQLNKKISVDATSKITKGVVSYFDGYTVVNDDGKYSLVKQGGHLTYKDGQTHAINFNSIKGDGEDGVVYAGNGTKLTIKGNIEAVESSKNYAMAVWADGANTEIDIVDGYFTQVMDGGEDSQYDLIYASGGAKINISGGTFKVGAGDPIWTLNCQDNKGSVITVTGGKFYKFDPSVARGSNDKSEVVVPDGYKVVQNGDWYTVVKKS